MRDAQAQVTGGELHVDRREFLEAGSSDRRQYADAVLARGARRPGPLVIGQRLSSSTTRWRSCANGKTISPSNSSARWRSFTEGRTVKSASWY